MTTGKASTASGGSEGLAVELERARREDGLSQAALAKVLGSSQANVSKLLRGLHIARPVLDRSIRDYLASRAGPASGSETWKAHVLAACERSEAFRGIVDAAFKLMNENE